MAHAASTLAAVCSGASHSTLHSVRPGQLLYPALEVSGLTGNGWVSIGMLAAGAGVLVGDGWTGLYVTCCGRGDGSTGWGIGTGLAGTGMAGTGLAAANTAEIRLRPFGLTLSKYDS